MFYLPQNILLEYVLNDCLKYEKVQLYIEVG